MRGCADVRMCEGSFKFLGTGTEAHKHMTTDERGKAEEGDIRRTESIEQRHTRTRAKKKRIERQKTSTQLSTNTQERERRR
jgi:hypothetical protein